MKNIIKSKKIKEFIFFKMSEKYIYVDDDWYPNYQGDKVKLNMVLYYSSNEKKYRYIKITAFGLDDFGLEIEYCNKKIKNLISKYKDYKKNIFYDINNVTNKNELMKKYGFTVF